MYLGCRFYPCVYVEFSRIPLEKKRLTYISMYHQLSNSGQGIRKTVPAKKKSLSRLSEKGLAHTSATLLITSPATAQEMPSCLLRRGKLLEDSS